MNKKYQHFVTNMPIAGEAQQFLIEIKQQTK
jgi:hypothetical protein